MHVPGVTEEPFVGSTLSSAVGGPVSLFETDTKLSSSCEFFADERRMVVVVRPDQTQTTADKALAWGLAYRGDRELDVVLPAERAWPTRVRVPWVLPTVRVFTYEGQAVAEPLPLTQGQSIAAFAGRTHSLSDMNGLGDQKDWLRIVTDWLSGAPGLDRVERPGYVAWHVAGRQVLKLTPGTNRLAVAAGVQSSRPEQWPPVVNLTLTEPAADHQQFEVVAAVARAAAARLAGTDAGHREHRMQSVLRPESLGLSTGWRREFPAWRPGSDRAAFIDFLACDPSKRVTVVETKIGPDEMLVLQGLDYWLWCRANLEDACSAVGGSPHRLPKICYVVAPRIEGGEPISIYTAAQAEALHRDVDWAFVVVDDADTGRGVHLHPPYTVPKPHRRAARTDPRWMVRLGTKAKAAAERQGAQLQGTHSFPTVEEAFLPDAMAAYEVLLGAGLVHGYIRHVRSSQAFALNLLAPLGVAEWTSIARHYLQDQDAVVDQPPEFEYTDPGDALSEATKASPHVTQVDCLVRIDLVGGRRHALLIEVKLSEDTFSTCSAYSSPRNPRRSICGQPGPFGGDPVGCFQLSNHDRDHRRRYDQFLGSPKQIPPSFGCWFRDGANQVMRNVALANALIERGEVDSASMVLLAPDDHTAIWTQWRQHLEYLSAYGRVSFGGLPASQITALHPEEQARKLTARYLLSEQVLEVRLAQRLVDERFAAGAVLVRLENDRRVRYRQALTRLPVVAADDETITLLTDYPAGPFEHMVSRSVLVGGDESIEVPDPEGDGSRLLSPDLRHLGSTAEAEELRRAAQQDQLRSPWWTMSPG